MHLNPDLSQLLISADRSIKVLREQIPHEIGRNKLTWPLVICSIIIFQFQTASSRILRLGTLQKSHVSAENLVFAYNKIKRFQRAVKPIFKYKIFLSFEN